MGRKLLNSVRSFDWESKTCVNRKDGDWCQVKVSLPHYQVCVMPPWVFNSFMFGVIRTVNNRGLEQWWVYSMLGVGRPGR